LCKFFTTFLLSQRERQKQREIENTHESQAKLYAKLFPTAKPSISKVTQKQRTNSSQQQQQLTPATKYKNLTTTTTTRRSYIHRQICKLKFHTFQAASHTHTQNTNHCNLKNSQIPTTLTNTDPYCNFKNSDIPSSKKTTHIIPNLNFTDSKLKHTHTHTHIYYCKLKFHRFEDFFIKETHKILLQSPKW